MPFDTVWRVSPLFRALVVVVSGLMTALSVAAPARAAEYHVYTCGQPDGKPQTDVSDWQFWVSKDSGAVAKSQCPTRMYASMVPPYTGTSGGDSTQIRLELPDALRAVGLKARRSVVTRSTTAGNSFSRYTLSLGAYGPDPSAENCGLQVNCRGIAWPGVDSRSTTIDLAFPWGTNVVAFVLSCDGAGSCVARDETLAEMSVSDLDVTVRDAAGPEVTAVGGEMATTDEATGIEPLTYTAADLGSGIAATIVRWDGRELQRIADTTLASCHDVGSLPVPEYARLQPCTQHLQAAVGVDTRVVTNGRHRVTIVTADAAGNETLLFDRSITVDNGGAGAPPAAPPTPAPVPTTTPAPNGRGGEASGAARPGTLVAPPKQRALTVAYAAKPAITGRLENPARQPLGGASVDVLERLDRSSATWMKVATVTTDGKGAYRYVPATTASRTVRFAYAAVAGGAYTSTRDVAVGVRAGLSIVAADRVVHPHGVIDLSGAVKLDGLPARARVEVQYRTTGGWQTFGTAKIDGKGHWAYAHHLRTAHDVTYSFRSLLRPGVDLPSARSASSPVRVRVT